MSSQVGNEKFKNELFECLDETFEQNHGLYLEKGTSFFDTLEGVSAEDASRAIIENGATIAAHIEHTRFYLDVLDEMMRKQEVPPADWQEIWKNVRRVSPAEWEKQKRRLKESYQKVSETIRNYEHWENGYGIEGSLSVLVHSAYHLGAIRQMLVVIKSNKIKG